MNSSISLARVAGTTLARAIVPSRRLKRPAINYAHVTSDKAASVLKFRVGGRVYTTTAAAAASQAVVSLDDATGLTANDVLVVEPADGSAPFVNTFASATGNDATLNSNFTAILPVGSKIYLISDRAQLPVGAASLERPANGPGDAETGIFYGESGRPILLELDGTSACSINLVTATYDDVG